MKKTIQNKKLAKYLIAVVIAVVAALAFNQYRSGTSPSTSIVNSIDSFKGERPLVFNQLKTNTDKTSIDPTQVLSGGPGKDGIPTLNNPDYTNITNSKVTDDTLGIFIEINNQKRFYPFSILVWHEIANDKIGSTSFSVTFCPLCGSAIVYNRDVQGEILQFGVSGLLYESNLLMYDTKTESLWSQSLGEAVVGDFTGTKLEIIPMQRLTFAQVKSNHPTTMVLSEDTGYSRNYSSNPYGNYDQSDRLIFPVSNTNEEFPTKEIMYVIRVKDQSVVIPQLQLKEGQTISKTITGSNLTATKTNGEITATIDGVVTPGYFEMWFSWATQHKDNGIVWKL